VQRRETLLAHRRIERRNTRPTEPVHERGPLAGRILEVAELPEHVAGVRVKAKHETVPELPPQAGVLEPVSGVPERDHAVAAVIVQPQRSGQRPSGQGP
jgi:hypothetical protein